MGNRHWSAGDVSNSLEDPYSTVTGLELKTSVGSYVSGSGLIAWKETTGLGLRNLGLGLVTRDFPNFNQNIFGFDQQTSANLAFFASPLARVSAGQYTESLPLGGLSESLYGRVGQHNKYVRFEVKTILEFNDGTDVPDEMLEEQKRELLQLFDGVSWDLQPRGGAWKDRGTEYRNTHLNLTVDAPNTEHNRRIMLQFKERWRQRLGQVELYVTTSIVEIM
jgi:hypothetical protein